MAMQRVALATLGLLGAAFSLAITASAQSNWPTQPIKWIVPYPPGGNTDVLSRAIAEKIAPALGQPIIIENRPGANTITGTTALARADDGHTIGLIVDAHPINAAFGRPLPYDSAKDFAPIVQLVRVPFVIVSNPEKLPARSIAEFVQHAKANPGKVSYASLGPGSPHQIAMEHLRALAGIDVLIVPYRGVAPAMNDVLAGHVHTTVMGLATARPQIEAGKLRALAVTSPQRFKQLPDVPTVAEQGFQGYSAITWYGMAGPRSMPAAVVVRLNAEINKALALPDIAQRIVEAGTEAVGGTPEAFAKVLVDDIAKFTEIFKISGSKPE